MASNSYDTKVNILNPATGESIQKYTKHKNTFNCLDQIDEDTMVSGSYDNTVHIWKISTGQTLNTINAGDWVISVKSLSNGLIACGLYRNINIYEYSTGNLVKTLTGQSGNVYSLEILNEQFMASGGQDQRVIIWDIFSYSISHWTSLLQRQCPKIFSSTKSLL